MPNARPLSWGPDRQVPRRRPGPAARLPAAIAGAADPERCVEAYYLQRTRFESIAERKQRRRQLTEDGNVEISGRCALKAHETMSPEMAAAVKPSRQPRTESCVVSGNGLCEA
jgi:hypothetical protein